MRHAWGLSKPSGSLSTVRSASKRGGRLQALHRDVYPHDSSAPPHAVSNREKGLRALGRVRSTPTPRPAHRSSLTAHVAACLRARVHASGGFNTPKTSLSNSQSLARRLFCKRCKDKLQSKKDLLRAPQQTPPPCTQPCARALQIPTTANNKRYRQKWPTPTSLNNRSRRPRRRKRKPRPRPPP